MIPGTPDPDAWRREGYAPDAGTVLGPADEIPDGEGREYRFGPDHDPFRMFVVRRGRTVFGYLNRCPHFSLPLNHSPHRFIAPGGEIQCTRHFALFRVEDGRCLEGACPGRFLDPVPVEVTPAGVLRIATVAAVREAAADR